MKKDKMKVVKGNVVKGKKSLNDRIAEKVLAPYMDKVLHACYDLRELSYALSFDDWAKRVNEKLKEFNLSGIYNN